MATARSVWKGYLKVAEVICPVSLHAAASTAERVAFHTLNRKTGHRVSREYVDGTTGKPVPREAQVKGAFLAYPYIGFAALNRRRPWRHCPRTLAVVARRDHLTTVRNAEGILDMVRGCGVEVETWITEGTHSFDEPMNAPPMRYDEALAAEALTRFGRLLEDLAPNVRPAAAA